MFKSLLTWVDNTLLTTQPSPSLPSNLKQTQPPPPPPPQQQQQQQVNLTQIKNENKARNLNAYSQINKSINDESNLNNFVELTSEEREHIARVLERAKNDEINLLKLNTINSNEHNNKRNNVNLSTTSNQKSPQIITKSQSKSISTTNCESTHKIQQENVNHKIIVNKTELETTNIDNSLKVYDNTHDTYSDTSIKENEKEATLIDSLKETTSLLPKPQVPLFNCSTCNNSYESEVNSINCKLLCNLKSCKNSVIINENDNICNNCNHANGNDTSNTINKSSILLLDNNDSNTYLKYAQNKKEQLEETLNRSSLPPLSSSSSSSSLKIINNQVTHASPSSDQSLDTCFYLDNRGSIYNKLLDNTLKSDLVNVTKRVSFCIQENDSFEVEEGEEEEEEEIVFGTFNKETQLNLKQFDLKKSSSFTKRIKRQLPSAPNIINNNNDDVKKKIKHLKLPNIPSSSIVTPPQPLPTPQLKSTTQTQQTKQENVTEWLRQSFDKLEFSENTLKQNNHLINNFTKSTRQFSDESDTTINFDDIIEIKFNKENNSNTNNNNNVINDNNNINNEINLNNYESTHHLLDKNIRKILLYKDPNDKTQGLGIRLAAEQRLNDLAYDQLAAIVIEIIPNGLVHGFNVPISVGDEIVEINSICLRNKTQQEIIHLMNKSNIDGEIELLVRTHDALINEGIYLNDSTSINTFDPCKLVTNESAESLPFTLSSIKSQLKSLNEVSIEHPQQPHQEQEQQQELQQEQEKEQEDYFLNHFESNKMKQQVLKSQSLDRSQTMNNRKQISFKLNRSISNDKSLQTTINGELQLQIDHNSKQQQLNINVLRARNLLAKDTNGLSDPFVKIYLLPGRRDNANKRRTKTKFKTLNPEWNETLVYANLHANELKHKMLEITVWDYDRFKPNDFLGLLIIDLNVSNYIDGQPHWYTLRDNRIDDKKKCNKKKVAIK